MPGQESGAPQRTGRVGGLGIIANVRAVVVIKQKVRRETPQSSGRVRTRPHRHVRRRTSDVARRAGEHAGESAVACGGVMGGRARAVGQYAVNIVARAAAGAGVWVSRGGDWGGPRVGPCACRANGACASSPRSRCPPASCVPRTTVRHISHVHAHVHAHVHVHVACACTCTSIRPRPRATTTDNYTRTQYIFSMLVHSYVISDQSGTLKESHQLNQPPPAIALARRRR